MEEKEKIKGYLLTFDFFIFIPKFHQTKRERKIPRGQSATPRGERKRGEKEKETKEKKEKKKES